MSRLNRHNIGTVFVLLGNGFAEQETVACVERMRQTNVPVFLVGITAGLITGKHGLKIKSDYSLEEVKAAPLPKMVIIPNGIEIYLATDPRVHHLINDTLGNQGIVAAMSTAEPFLYECSGDYKSQFNLQGRRETAVFIDQLIDLLG